MYIFLEFHNDIFFKLEKNKVLLRSKNTELYIYYHRFFAIVLFYGLNGNTILLSLQNIDELKLRSIII